MATFFVIVEDNDGHQPLMQSIPGDGIKPFMSLFESQAEAVAGAKAQGVVRFEVFEVGKGVKIDT
ncbi:MAG: hypothetical protein HRT35_00895 [Algicola sp.]|nr:hypothetical protein [Algicola sp.]